MSNELTAAVDQLISAAREAFSFQPDPTADADTRTVWASTFFEIANDAIAAGADPADLVQEVDRAYAIVATLFPPSTTDWPVWADPLMKEAALRAKMNASVADARARIERLRQSMAKLTTSQGTEVAGGSVDKAPALSAHPSHADATTAPATGEEVVAPQGQDLESGRKRLREDSETTSSAPPAGATSKTADDAMPAAKRRAPDTNGRKEDALKPRLTDRACDRCRKMDSDGCIMRDESKCSKCRKDRKSCKFDGLTFVKWKAIRDPGAAGPAPAIASTPASDAPPVAAAGRPAALGAEELSPSANPTPDVTAVGENDRDEDDVVVARLPSVLQRRMGNLGRERVILQDRVGLYLEMIERLQEEERVITGKDWGSEDLADDDD